VWLKPKLVAQIEFTEWTPDGHLMHSKFVRLREDKEAGGSRLLAKANEALNLGRASGAGSDQGNILI
jgi:bifunctional non-homologous end joining protein LigD